MTLKQLDLGNQEQENCGNRDIKLNEGRENGAAGIPLDVERADGVHTLALSGALLPLVLTQVPSEASTPPSCEGILEWKVHPLRCRQLSLSITCSARHVELFIEGVRRSLLGEDEHVEVYIGTFRGQRQGPAVYGPASATTPQRFAISEQFLQRDRDHDVLKEVHNLRVKFVSLTGDKSALHLHEFKCSYVPMQVYVAAPTQAAASVGDQPVGQILLHACCRSPIRQPQAAPGNVNIAAQLAGLSLGGSSVGAFGGLETQMVMKGFQQMLERELETKIMSALDEKLSMLSQRLTFSEQRIFQLQQQLDTKDAHTLNTINEIKQQFAELETHVKQQLKAPVVTDRNDEDEEENGEEN
ncbi:hypothetical protein FI667_g2640, partial [Globisporangium splendens]